MMIAVAVISTLLTNPAVTQDTIKSTICVSGWTSQVRPPVKYTDGIKFALMRAARIPRSRAKKYELDHFLPIELGGSPTSPHNLRLQPWVGVHGAHAKDAEENALKRDVCAGRLELEDAQAQMIEKWEPFEPDPVK